VSALDPLPPATTPDATPAATPDATPAATPDATPDAAPDAGEVSALHGRGRYESATAGWLGTLRRYVLVTKPRIIELLLITTVPSMVVAAGGWPGTWRVAATLLGGTLSAGSANAINNHLDRDIDRIMDRTSGRPTASDQIPPGAALRLGLVLGVVGFAWLALLVNLAAALMATSAILFYVFVYTLGLKRRTSQAVVIGGAAGCAPVLTGWVAVPGASLADPTPWLLFAILFWWQPPHFWALAIKYREDYAKAGLPMLPVIAGVAETTRQIWLYSWLLLSIVLLYAVGAGPTADVGPLFVVTAGALTIGWLWLAWQLRRDRTVKAAMRLFIWSTSWLALVFTAAAVDAVL